MANVKGFPKAFSAIKARDIFDYMTAVGASDDVKAEFMEKAYTKRPRKKAKDAKDIDGNTILIPQYDKNGNKIGDRVKKVMENAADGEELTVFNLTRAKKWFKEKYPDAVITKGERVAESEVFAGWGKPKTTTDKTTQEEEN